MENGSQDYMPAPVRATRQGAGGYGSVAFDGESYRERLAHDMLNVPSADAGVLRGPTLARPKVNGKPSQVVLAMHQLEEALDCTSNVIDELEQRVASVSRPRPPQTQAAGGGADAPRAPTAPLAEAVEMMAQRVQILTRRLVDVITGLEV